MGSTSSLESLECCEVLKILQRLKGVEKATGQFANPSIEWALPSQRCHVISYPSDGGKGYCKSVMFQKPDMIRGYQKNMGGQAHVHVLDAAGVPLSFSIVLAVRLNWTAHSDCLKQKWCATWKLQWARCKMEPASTSNHIKSTIISYSCHV